MLSAQGLSQLLRLRPALGLGLLQQRQKLRIASTDESSDTCYRQWAYGLSALGRTLLPSLIGMIASFAAGLLALRWLSAWLEHGRWRYFGFYCLAAALMVFLLGRTL